MLLQDILREKGTAIHTIDPDSTLDDVVQRLVQHNCGSLVVCPASQRSAAPRLVGIITERDILRYCAARRGPLDRVRVAEVMTRDVIIAAPEDEIGHVMGLMTVNRIRHLPVVSEGELVGLISIGDVVKAQHAQMALENHYLKTYLEGGA
jgi:CBS domain-containing protein